MSKAIDDVLAERRRQVEVEGWTAEHDDVHSGGELALAASVYADPYPRMVTRSRCMEDRGGTVWQQPERWPWGPEWYKPKDRRRDLIRAAALLIAEIERIDRAKLPKDEAK